MRFSKKAQVCVFGEGKLEGCTENCRYVVTDVELPAGIGSSGLAVERLEGCRTATDPRSGFKLAAYTSRMSVPNLDLEKLTRDEKLELIEKLWDSLDADTDNPIPEWHRRELERRLDESDREGPTGIPWEQLVQEIQSRFK
jgi:putative addiction module component (TIGR02574 family)